MKKMFLKLVLLCLCLWRLDGVSGEDDGEISVKEGNSVTLNSGLTELSKDDVIQWGYGQESTLIAEINKQDDRITYYDVLGERFTDRLKLDEQTGSLTITNITNEQTGYYRRIINGVSKSFLLIVHAGDISVEEGDSVTLDSNIAEIRDDDFTEWLFIAKNYTDAIAYSTSGFVLLYKRAVQGIFTDKLKLDIQTGSLSITNVTREHAGKYILMTSNGGVRRSFNLRVSGVSGDEVNEENVFTILQEVIKHANRIPFYGVLGGRIGDRLKLDEPTRSLTITNGKRYYKRIINDETISAAEGASVTLDSNIAKIGDDDFIHWLFIAKNKTDVIAYSTSGSVMFYKRAVRGIFRDKLKLDIQTGSLTITNVTREHAGNYVLMVSSEDVRKSFKLTVSGTVTA